MIDQKAGGRASAAHARGRGWAIILIAIASLAANGCATGGGGETGSMPPSSAENSLSAGGTPMQVQPGKPGSTVGVWEGVSLANCVTSASNRCNAQNKISITLLQGDTGLRGFYTCGYSCYGGGALIESGNWQGRRSY